MKNADDFGVLVVCEQCMFEIPGSFQLMDCNIHFDRAADTDEALTLWAAHTYELVMVFQYPDDNLWEELLKNLGENNTQHAYIILYTHEQLAYSSDHFLKEYPRITDSLVIPQNKHQFLEQVRTYIIFWRKTRAYELKIQKEQYTRQVAESESIRIQTLFDNIIQNSDAGILLIDNEGIIRFVNKAAEKIFLRKSKEIIGKPFGLMNSEKDNTEIEIVRRSGEIGIGEITITETQWRKKPAKLIFINDVTKYKKLLKKYEKARKKAEESDRLKTSFLANMSHEIRTPMNGIVGFAQLLKEEVLDVEEKKKYLDIIISSGDHLLTLINDILDIAKIEAGQLNVKFTKCNLPELMQEVYDIMAINPKLDTQQVNFSLLPSEHAKLFVLTDAARLKQILINLINNAVKFTPEGSIEFGFRVLNEDKKLVFFVKDTGIGIPKKAHKQIFQRFRKLESGSSEELVEGTGIGLAICESLVKLMGGEIWLKSAEGKGTTFNFSIPFIEAGGEVETTSNQQIEIISNKELMNKRLLIVEDSDTNFILLSSVLKHFNIAIYWAKNGREAVNICEREEIDLVLMDIKLPVLNGLEATKQIKEKKPGLPVIAQTAYAMGSDKEKCLSMGCDDYIEKPFNVNLLLDKMTRVIAYG